MFPDRSFGLSIRTVDVPAAYECDARATGPDAHGEGKFRQ